MSAMQTDPRLARMISCHVPLLWVFWLLTCSQECHQHLVIAAWISSKLDKNPDITGIFFSRWIFGGDRSLHQRGSVLVLYTIATSSQKPFVV